MNEFIITWISMEERRKYHVSDKRRRGWILKSKRYWHPNQLEEFEGWLSDEKK